jgi:hypothetical protein
MSVLDFNRRTAVKEFKGIISNWTRDGDVVVGTCDYHVNAVPFSPEALLSDQLIEEQPMHTSRVERIEDRGAFSICETKNSFYVLVAPR